jgi:hypothetical protein
MFYCIHVLCLCKCLVYPMCVNSAGCSPGCACAAMCGCYFLADKLQSKRATGLLGPAGIKQPLQTQ